MDERLMGLSDEQTSRVAALRAARDLVLNPHEDSYGAVNDVGDLITISRYIETGDDPYVTTGDAPPAKTYPYSSGDQTVLGPETFIEADGKVISHKGRNYYRPDAPQVTDRLGGDRDELQAP